MRDISPSVFCKYWQLLNHNMTIKKINNAFLGALQEILVISD